MIEATKDNETKLSGAQPQIQETWKKRIILKLLNGAYHVQFDEKDGEIVWTYPEISRALRSIKQQFRQRERLNRVKNAAALVMNQATTVKEQVAPTPVKSS